ncbi:hypothetical protein DFH07DRAFT_501345 [Mycena maculata]|uniref:DUF6535 domain-containing protein n=1 Tax=Mycena maculata TaxID=230809 RepID=A0AAD7J3F8_9AGAR|nr:hypothetical protein DFH07DRAFT_501345 [Mycena maculata]
MKSDDVALSELGSILELLRRIDERQASADTSQQPIPEVPASSSSAWNPLLRSALDVIEPTVNRWRGSLDTLLIFIGLFSAIVTALFVQSVTSLSQDPAARTNELLANLTEIIISLSNVDFATLHTLAPSRFEPDTDSVRLNVYWSLSLIISVSIAALAVTCRGFLAGITRSDHSQASKKFTEISSRWQETNVLLGPSVEILPQLMFLPVMLFVAGLLDNLYSSALDGKQLSIPILVASTISSACVAALALFLVYTFLDGVLRPDASAFHSSAAHAALNTMKRLSWRQGPTPHTGEEPLDTLLTAQDRETYHKVLQLTHDDYSLDRASACLNHHVSSREYGRSPALSDMEVDTILHLLSPDASVRSNLTAAEALIKLRSYVDPLARLVTYKQLAQLLDALIENADRQAARSPTPAVLWDSKFTQAMTALMQSYDTSAPVLGILCSTHVTLSLTPYFTRHVYGLIDYAFSALQTKLAEEGQKYCFAPSEDADGMLLDVVLGSAMQAVPSNIAVGRLLTAIIFVLPNHQSTALALLRWLCRQEPDEVAVQSCSMLHQLTKTRVHNLGEDGKVAGLLRVLEETNQAIDHPDFSRPLHAGLKLLALLRDSFPGLDIFECSAFIRSLQGLVPATFRPLTRFGSAYSETIRELRAIRRWVQYFVVAGGEIRKVAAKFELLANFQLLLDEDISGSNPAGWASAPTDVRFAMSGPERPGLTNERADDVIGETSLQDEPAPMNPGSVESF